MIVLDVIKHITDVITITIIYAIEKYSLNGWNNPPSDFRMTTIVNKNANILYFIFFVPSLLSMALTGFKFNFLSHPFSDSPKYQDFHKEILCGGQWRPNYIENTRVYQRGYHLVKVRAVITK